MALRAIWGFQHLPQGTSAGVSNTGYGLAYSGLSYTTGNVYQRTMTIEDNAIKNVTTGTIYGNFVARMVDIFDGTSPEAIFGYRYRQAGANILTTAILTFAGVSVSRSELGVTASNVEYLIEVVCDRRTNEVSFFVNGAFVVTKVANTTPLVPDQTITFSFGYGSTGPGYLSDFYFIDDTQDDTPCTRLGAVRVTPLAINSATAQDWTVSDGGTIAAALSAGYTNAASMTTPTVTSPITQTSLAVGFSPLSDVYAKIHGVVALLDAQRVATTTPAVDVSVTDGSATAAISTIAFASDGWKYGLATKVITKAADGTLLSTAKLAAMKITFKPKTAT